MRYTYDEHVLWPPSDEHLALLQQHTVTYIHDEHVLWVHAVNVHGP